MFWVVAALAVVLPACSCGSSTAHCLASNCLGCCDNSDQCQPGSDFAACGTQGAGCATCVPGQVCSGGGCVQGSGDSGSCGPGNCTGCCQGGSCQGGTALTACGSNGNFCQACGNGQHCNAAGQCVGSNCNGCQGTDGGCQPGTANAACGTGGVSCVACGGTNTCMSGQCMAPDAGPCDAANCMSGCCGATGCVPFAMQTVSACGKGGNTCLLCSGGQACQAGSCQDAGTCGVCAGCCSGASCIQPSSESDAVCGAGAEACGSCVPAAKKCGLGDHTCATAGAGALGTACTTDGQCALGTNSHEPYCVVTWPGGYCDDRCDSNHSMIGACPTGDYCLGMLGQIDAGDYLGLCLLHCVNSAGCNAFDSCDLTVGDSTGYCVPKCTTAAECGGFFNDPSAGCNAATGLCCGIANFACCAGSQCLDGTTCVAGKCS